MNTVFQWLLRLTTGIIVLIALVFALVWYFASRSLPDYTDSRSLEGISGPVEIVRDHSNVPHIFAQTDSDVFFALGYAHAQDRLWQMTMLRRTVQGRLSELFGERTFSIDSLMRRLDFYGAARASVPHQDPYTSTALKAYAAGVNAWIGQVQSEALGRGAPEMWLFNHAIAPWQPADSIAIIKLMAIQLSGDVYEEVLRARTSLAIPQDRVDDILPTPAGEPVAALPPYASIVGDLPKFAANTTEPSLPVSPFRPRGLTGASNAWAAASNRSISGSTLLANDPHLGLSAPSPMYLARLELQAGGIIGAGIPGVPAIMVGRSADLGWGLTTAYVDDQDILIEEVNPQNPDEYRGLNGWQPFEFRDSIIEIDGAPARTIRLQWTENGPVLPPDQFNLGTIRPAGHVTALSWTALSREDTSISAAIGLMRSRSVNEAIAAGAKFVAPAQNVTIADRNQIALKTVGHIPARDPNHHTQGRLPSYGYEPVNRWQGVQPYSGNPEFLNPEGGIVGNTNNKVIDRPFPNHVSFNAGDTQRVQRWRRLMQIREVHTRDSFIEAQLDTVSFTARSLLPLIGAELWFTGEPAQEGTPERKRQIALDLLSQWNGEMNEHLPEPLIYSAWLKFLQEKLIRDELGPLAFEYKHVEPLFIERVFRDQDGAAVWCDIIRSSPKETCSEIAATALDAAILWIEDRYGSALESLRWGDAHEATHDHPVLGTTPILSWFVNIRQSTSGGDNTLMRGRTSAAMPDPFQNVHAAAYRGVYDFADPDSSVFVISTGQSGHPLSRHYDDLSELWRIGEYIPMSLDPALARAAAVGVTQLTPKSE